MGRDMSATIQTAQKKKQFELIYSKIWSDKQPEGELGKKAATAVPSCAAVLHPHRILCKGHFIKLRVSN